jgi:hypothetical protein
MKRSTVLTAVVAVAMGLVLASRATASDQPVQYASAKGAFHEVYAFPNPAKDTSAVTFHAGIDNATGLQVKVYNIAGELIHEGSLSGDPSIIQGSSAYEYKWNFGDLASGAYFLVVKAQTDNGTDSIAKKTFVVVR